MELYISSGKHVSDIEKRQKDIESSLTSPGLIFIEGTDHDTSKKRLAYFFVFFPLLVGPLIVWNWILSGLRRSLKHFKTGYGEDSELAQELEKKHDIEVIRVGTDRLDLIERDKDLWWKLNWIFAHV